ncbi:hypothetical protein LZ31DRAFT_303059 [Colletotrichum somersetense]|nr:hypothetical protein LZ31DRAFT_303059 [Colletotrichum somersetense]
MLHLVFLPHVIVLRTPRSRSVAYMDRDGMFGMCVLGTILIIHVVEMLNAGIDAAAMCTRPRLLATSSQVAAPQVSYAALCSAIGSQTPTSKHGFAGALRKPATIVL